MLHSTKHLCLLVFLLATAVFLNTLPNGFAFDDLIHISTNPAIRSVEQSLRYFTQPTFPGDLYRPIVFLSYSLTHHFFGLEPFAYHLTNVLLHGGVSVLVFLLISEICSRRTALFTALIFAIHPLHTEVVANVTGRTELLSGFFMLYALLLLLRQRSSDILTATGAGLSFLLALLSKESAFSAFLLLPLLIWFKSAEEGYVRRVFIRQVPLLIMGAIYLALRINVIGSMVSPDGVTLFIDNPLISLGAAERVINALSGLGRYIFLCFVPIQLSADYSYQAIPFLSLKDITGLFLLLLALLALVFGVLGLVQRRLFAFFSLWFFGAFVVTSNIAFPIGTIFAERLAYIPSLGIIGLLALAFSKLSASKLMTPVFSLLLLIFFIKTWLQSENWRSNESLHRAQIYVAPSSAKVQLNYSIVLWDEGRHSEALQHIELASKLYPKFAKAAWGKGIILLSKGELAKAEAAFSRSLGIDPDFADSHVGLAKVAALKGDVELAEERFLAALRRSDTHFEAQIGMVWVALERGNLKSAREQRDRLMKWDSTHEQLNILSQEIDRRLVTEPEDSGSYQIKTFQGVQAH